MFAAMLGASISGTATYFGCTLGAKIDSQTSALVAGGVALVVGVAYAVNGPKESGVSNMQKEWEKEL